MINWDKPIRTKCGKPAKTITRDYKSFSEGVVTVVQIELSDNSSVMACYNQDGSRIGAYEIENIPEERWIIEWLEENGSFLTCKHYPSKEKALRVVGSCPKGGYKIWRLVDDEG